MSEIRLKKYDYRTWETKETGETVDTWTIAHSMTAENMADLMEEYANYGGREFRAGQEIGRLLWNTHRHLQHLLVQFCLGIVHEMGKQKWSDARNEFSLRVCQRVSQLLEAEFSYWFPEEKGE